MLVLWREEYQDFSFGQYNFQFICNHENEQPTYVEDRLFGNCLTTQEFLTELISYRFWDCLKLQGIKSRVVLERVNPKLKHMKDGGGKTQGLLQGWVVGFIV